MTTEPESTGITVHGTALSEEETAALLAVVNTQLVNTVPEQRLASYTTQRITSTWASSDSWHYLPPGH